MMQHLPHKRIDGPIHVFGDSVLMLIARQNELVLDAIFRQVLRKRVRRVLTAVVTSHHLELFAIISLYYHMISLEAVKFLGLRLHHVHNGAPRVVVDERDEKSRPTQRRRAQRTMYVRVNLLQHL